MRVDGRVGEGDMRNVWSGDVGVGYREDFGRED